MESILVVEDTESLREVLCTVLDGQGYQVTGAASAEEALEILDEDQFSLVLSDLKLPGLSGLEFLEASRASANSIPVVVMTAYGSIDIAVEAMKLGATDFITKPFDPDRLCRLLEQIFEHQRIINRSIGGKPVHARTLRSQCPSIERLLSESRKVAALSSSVLILGESGTGKELLAHYIHEQSPRKDDHFVAINCGSMPSELLESEFFGHEAGSFTGATQQRVGLFEVANGGTIFLDEIGNMPSNLQTKLLRTLQESEIRPLGCNETRKIDTRVISATNCNIEEEISDKKFREDLYYRLGVVILEIPPLRDRSGDVTLLANYFVKCLNKEFSKETPNTLSLQALQLLESYPWPGNVRELENTIERAMIFHDGELTPECFELADSGCSADPNHLRTLPEIVGEAQRKAEVETITRVLTQTGGNKSKAAKLLGVSYKTLLNKVKEYKIGASNKPAETPD